VDEFGFAKVADFVDVHELKEHEQTEYKHLHELKEKIKSDGILKKSIAVDKNTNLVIDGHYRLNALKALGAKKIPVTYFDYQHPQIKVATWREHESITKEQVIDAALSGKKFPPKSSRHMIQNNGSSKHISEFEVQVNIPLDKLKTKGKKAVGGDNNIKIMWQ